MFEDLRERGGVFRATPFGALEVADDFREHIGAAWVLPFVEDVIVERDRKENLAIDSTLATFVVFSLECSLQLTPQRVAV